MMVCSDNIKQIIIRFIFAGMGGLLSTIGSFLIVSICISIVAIIQAFKNQGETLDHVAFQPYIDRIVHLLSFPSFLVMIFVLSMFFALKWNEASKIDQFIFTLSGIIFVNLLSHHFGGAATSITALLVQYLIIYVIGMSGMLLAPYYRNWKKNKHLKKSNKVLQHYHLTQRERDIVYELLNGKSNKEIGHKLYIEEGTVKQHLKSIFKKTGVSRRFELIHILNIKLKKKVQP